MSAYRVIYQERRPHPAGGTYLADIVWRTLEASDARTARDAIRGLHPGAKIKRVVNLDAQYENRARRAESARNR